MRATTITRIEGVAEVFAAASLAGALGYAVTAFMAGFSDLPIAFGLAASAIAFTAVLAALKRIDPPIADMAIEEPLLLDDRLAEVGPESRVVQMFERRQQPNAGELAERIDRHLAARPQVESADDSAALFDALNQLRGNLR